MTTLPKVAIAIFVKNEVHDIAGWLAWHFALGVDKIYVYDDNSSDGTYEVLQNAATIFDISIFRTNFKSEGDFYWRQRDSYLDAIARSSGEYDWLGFLDSDEYLSLDTASSVQEFLSNMKHASAVALSWCIYGSSSRVIRSKSAVYSTYPYHSTKDLDDNHLVKSFIRPEDAAEAYENPHRFVLKNGNYVDSSGNSFEWDGARKNVDWHGARVNHYIVRSMENYVERIRRRLGADLSNSTAYWNHFDKNDVYEPPRNDFAVKADANRHRIQIACVSSFIKNFQHNRNILLEKSIDSNRKVSRFYKIKTLHGTFVSINNIDGHLCQIPDAQDSKFNIIGIVYEDELNSLYVVSIVDGSINNIIFHITGIPKNDYIYKFHLDKFEDTDSVTLKSFVTEKYICFVPPEYDGAVNCSRTTPSEWERVCLEEVQMHELKLSSSYSFVNDLFSFYGALSNYGQHITYNDFLMMVSGLSEEDRRKIPHLEGGSQVVWII